MSNFWQLKKQIVIDGGEPTWPSTLHIKIDLEPKDFFGSESPRPRTTVNAETEFKVDGLTGEMSILRGALPDTLDLNFTYPNGKILIDGGVLTLESQVLNLEHFQSTLNWLSVRLTQFLTIQIGIYFTLGPISGTIDGRPFSALHSGENYVAHLCALSLEERKNAIIAAMNGPSPEQQSYARYEVCARYYHHAVRLLSPHQVHFPPYVVHAEVLLNLAKCIELMYSVKKYQLIKPHLLELGLSEEQVDSQIIPIMIIRSELDVAHPSSGQAEPGEVAVLRKFVDRSVQNVAVLMRTIANRIREQPDYLAPLSNSSAGERAKFVTKLKQYLASPGLNLDANRPLIISMQMN